MNEKQQPPKRLLEMLEMKKAGYSLVEIGYKFNMTRQAVFQHLELDNLRKFDIDLEKYIVEK